MSSTAPWLLHIPAHETEGLDEPIRNRMSPLAAGPGQTRSIMGVGEFSVPTDLFSASQQVQGPDAAQGGERGVLGALGGSAAGAYIGKKTCHGFLGAVGGAIVGSLTEEYVKRGRKPSCSPSRPPHPECHCATPVHEPHCHQYHPPPKPALPLSEADS
jgi:hypothetical protein